MATASPFVPASSPVRKVANIPDSARAPTKYDSVPLSDDSVSSQQLQLFSPNPTQDIHRSYRQNPFQGSDSKQIIGVGFGLSVPLVYAETNINPRDIAQALQHSAVTIGMGDREETLYREHMSQFVDFAASEFVAASYDDGTNADSFEAYHLRSEGIVLLDDPTEIVLGGDQLFHLDVHFRSGYSLPTDAQWSNATQPTVRLVSHVQMIRN